MTDAVAWRFNVRSSPGHLRPQKAQACRDRGGSKKRGPKLRKEPEPDPDGEASVRAFFKRMMPDHPLLQDD